jgi:Na+-transporting NADH:ubiquinone oxidoreductase subunit NqrE
MVGRVQGFNVPFVAVLLATSAIVFGTAYLAGRRWGWLGLRLYALTAGVSSIAIGAAIGVGAELIAREMRRGVEGLAVVLCAGGLLLVGWAIVLGRD